MLSGFRIRRAFKLGGLLAVTMFLAWAIVSVFLGQAFFEQPRASLLVLALPLGFTAGTAHWAFKDIWQVTWTFGTFIVVYGAALVVCVGSLDVSRWVAITAAPLWLFIAYIAAGPSDSGLTDD